MASEDSRSGSKKKTTRRLRFSHRCKSTQMRYWDVKCVSVVGLEDKHQKGLRLDWWFEHDHDHDDADSWSDEDYIPLSVFCSRSSIVIVVSILDPAKQNGHHMMFSDTFFESCAHNTNTLAHSLIFAPVFHRLTPPIKVLVRYKHIVRWQGRDERMLQCKHLGFRGVLHLFHRYTVDSPSWTLLHKAFGPWKKFGVWRSTMVVAIELHKRPGWQMSVTMKGPKKVRLDCFT